MANANKTDWDLLGQAVEFYKSLGFKYIDTPWMVNPEVAAITCPDDKFHDIITTNGKALVASAEQGFLQLAVEDKLKGVNFVSCGPCFRLNDVIDEMHHRHFMKVELFVLCETYDVARYAASELVNRARSFMGHECKSVKTGKNSWDLEINGIEVGSYGARQHGDIIWAYGTGLALPRYNQALYYEGEEDVS